MFVTLSSAQFGANDGIGALKGTIYQGANH